MNIRPARYDDCAAVFRITQHPSVREASTRSQEFDYSSHQQWWDRRFAESGQRFYVAETEADGVVGYVRYGRVAGTADAEIAIAVAPEHRRSGLALRLLQETEALAKADLGVGRLIALVLVSNEASQKLFEKAGYRMSRWVFRLNKSHREYIKWLA